MIYQSDCWSVELPGTWRGVTRGNYSLFEANLPLGVLMIGSTVWMMTITDHDLKKRAYQHIEPDVQLEQVRLGVLSGFTAKYQKDKLSWQEWWLRHGTLMVHIAYDVPCETEPTGQESVMAILASLRIEGVETIIEQIDKNEDMKWVLNEHGIESIVHDDWIFPYNKLPAIRCLWLPVVSSQAGLLEVHVLCEKGDIIAECFAGAGEGDARYKDAFGKFLINSLHVFLAAFWDKDLEQITKEIWNINGRKYTAFIGQFGMINSGDKSGLIPETAFNEIEKAIKREKLTKPLHWIRTYVGNFNGKYIFESLLDNEIWPSGESVIKKIPWKKSDDYYSVRNFLILKQTGAYKWWRRFK